MTKLSTRDTFILFLRAGFSLPGTGYALLSLLETELVRRRALLAPDVFRDTAATAQCMPGVFAFNLGAGLGYQLGGWRGAAAGGAGLVVPAFVVMWLLAMWLTSGARPSAWLVGLRPAVVALVALALVDQVRRSGITMPTLWLPLTTLLLVWLFSVSPFAVVAVAAAGSYLYAKYVKPLQ